MFTTWVVCVVTSIWLLAGNVDSTRNSVTVDEFCACWAVQSSGVHNGGVFRVDLTFADCWLDALNSSATTTTAPGLDRISDTDLVKFGLTTATLISEERNCSIKDVCSISLNTGTLQANSTYTLSIVPLCNTCGNCNAKTAEFVMPTAGPPIPSTTPEPTRGTSRPRHKYLLPTMIVAGIACIIAAFIFVIVRGRERIKKGGYHRAMFAETDPEVTLTNIVPARKERLGTGSGGFADIQAEESDNTNDRGYNSDIQYGTSNAYGGTGNYLTNEKGGMVNGAFDYKT